MQRAVVGIGLSVLSFLVLASPMLQAHESAPYAKLSTYKSRKFVLNIDQNQANPSPPSAMNVEFDDHGSATVTKADFFRGEFVFEKLPAQFELKAHELTLDAGKFRVWVDFTNLENDDTYHNEAPLIMNVSIGGESQGGFIASFQSL